MAMPVLLIGAFAARLVSAQDTPTVCVRDAGALGPILVDARLHAVRVRPGHARHQRLRGRLRSDLAAAADRGR